MSDLYSIYKSPVDISLGRVGGAVPVTTTGVNLDVDTGVVETIWTQGGLYTHQTTAENVYIVSTSVADTGNTFSIEVLTDDYTKTNLNATPNGQTPVLLTGGAYKRFNRAINLSGVASQGTVYIYAGEGGATLGIPNNTSKILAKISIGKEISQNGIYTVPKGKRLLANTVRAYLGKNKDCDLSIYVYPKDNPVQFELIPYQVYQGILQDVFFTSPPYPEGTTFEFRATSANNNTAVTMSASSLLID